MNLWRALFAVAAVFNLAVGGAMMAGSAQVATQLGVTGPGATYAVVMCGLLIAMFGVGYAIVARDPAGNRGIVWIGAIGKLGAVVLAVLQYQQGLLPLNTLALGGGDLVFVLLFTLFLWRGPRPS